MTELNSSAEVRSYVQNRIGFIELNRPQALNALSLGMIRALSEALAAWRDNPEVLAVVIHSPHPRAFCAGGDVRALYEAGKQGDRATIDAFFTEEYTLNHAIFSFPKPYIALMHGVVMGGGMGISQAAHHTGGLRVVTDSTKMAMPETRIGLFPDVGMSWFLARLEGQLGRYLAVTGATLDAAGALYAGLADAYLPDAALPGLIEALKRESFADGAAVVTRVAEAASQHRLQPGDAALAEMRDAIDTHFARDSLADIAISLEGARASERHGAWAAYTVETLQALSPLSMAVSIELVGRARGASMADCLRTDLGLTRTTFAQGDVQEGIRARLVDKDNAPHWRHASIADVTPEDVAAMFASPWTPAEHPLAGLHD
jgi:enoyl-CoA hydratase/carnithine racemase